MTSSEQTGILKVAYIGAGRVNFGGAAGGKRISLCAGSIIPVYHVQM